MKDQSQLHKYSTLNIQSLKTQKLPLTCWCTCIYQPEFIAFFLVVFFTQTGEPLDIPRWFVFHVGKQAESCEVPFTSK